MQTEVKTLFKRVDENREGIRGMERIYQMIYEQNTNIGLLAEQMKNANKDMDDIKSSLSNIETKVDDIEKRPAQNYYHYIKLAVGGIITFLVGYAMANIFKGGI